MLINPKATLGKLYCIVTLFLLAFVNFNGATDFFDMTVPFLEGYVIIIHFLISIVFVLLLMLMCMYDRELKIDSVAVGLIIKIYIDALPFFTDTVEFHDYFWHWSCTCVSLIVYLIILNAHFNGVQENTIKIILLTFGAILAIQVIYTYFNCNYDYLDLQYKMAMVIPYGGSNIIASALLPLLFLAYYSIDKKLIRLGFFSLLIAGVVLTKSRGAMLYGAAVLFLCLYQHNKGSSKPIIRNMHLVVAAGFLTGALISDESFLKLMQGFQTGNTHTLSGFTSGRISLWEKMLATIFQSNFLFGVGMKSLAGHAAGAHNVIIDSLYKGGVIGGLNYIVILITLYRYAVKCIKTTDKAFGVMVLVLMGNMMYEVNYFSYNCDVFFWIIAGMLMSNCYRNENQFMS